MGGSPAPSPSVQYIPAPPPPGPPTQVPTQSLSTQTALDQTSAAQQQLNAVLGAQLDQATTDFNTTEAIRQTQATGAENRLQIQTQGEEQRATNLQQNMEARYIANRNQQWAQNAYHA
jgi:NaMN:DMB phosphoribosyltransferase